MLPRRPREEVVRSLAHRLSSLCDETAASIELDHRELIDALLFRGVCGDHGRVVPTFQDLCPECAGYVEIMSESKLAAMKRFVAYLATCDVAVEINR